ncbi:MAG TPA: MaoC/PaaZ C-terminal domain-containing protein [Acidimicrobiales bacterium]|nr:MaoC/PaaZ C-terminal domain-containing protein [Acidimicrobiales bacterium]
MPINPDAVGTRSAPVRRSWSSKDSLLYALGVGAGAEDPAGELAFTTENSQDVRQRALPTQAVVLGTGGAEVFGAVGPFNPAMLVHGEQSVTLARELPPAGEIETVTEIVGVYDKGSGALVVGESTATLVSDGEPLFTTSMGAFIRGEGGWGGDRGPSAKFEAPDRAPDHEVTYPTRIDQALLYRLSGDRNPLHSDPKFAALAGFPKPILHGLCTYGFTGRALLHTVCDGDPALFRSMSGRFSSPVFPGESLTVRIWTEGDGAAVFQTTGPDGRVVLDAGAVAFGAG